MLKLIPVILLSFLTGIGGAMVSVPELTDNLASANLQSYMCVNKNVDSNLHDNSDLFMRANTNPSL